MNDPKLELLIKKKMEAYVPCRSVQVMHGGVIVLLSIVIGVLYLSSEQGNAQGFGAGLGVYLAILGLALYVAWTSLRIKKAQKEAHQEFLAAKK